MMSLYACMNQVYEILIAEKPVKQSLFIYIFNITAKPKFCQDCPNQNLMLSGDYLDAKCTRCHLKNTNKGENTNILLSLGTYK